MSERFSHWIHGADELDAFYDIDETSYLTFEEYQRLQTPASNDADGTTDPNEEGNAAEPDVMTAIRLSAMLSADEATDARFGASVRTASEQLNVPPVEVEMEITRALRRSGIDAEPRRGDGSTLCAKFALKSALGEAPTRLAVAGLRGVYIEDSYFMWAAERVITMPGEINSHRDEPKRLSKRLFFSPKQRYMQSKLAQSRM